MTQTPRLFARVLVLTLLPAILTGCIERKPEVQTKKESPVTAEMATMLREHELMRASGQYPMDLIREADLRHRQTVYQLLAQALIVEPADLFRAAILLQSFDSTVCAENSMLAYYCAVESARRGYEDARRLAAESLDRYLIANGLAQKYGTQFTRDPAGQFHLFPFDTATTDADRATWNVPPLDSLKSLAAKQSQKAMND